MTRSSDPYFRTRKQGNNLQCLQQTLHTADLFNCRINFLSRMGYFTGSLQGLLYGTYVDEMFMRFSAPEQLHSDQDWQFESQLINEVCKLVHIKKTRTKPYYPQCDGMVTRFNRTLLNMLTTHCKDHPWDWEQHIQYQC